MRSSSWMRSRRCRLVWRSIGHPGCGILRDVPIQVLSARINAMSLDELQIMARAWNGLLQQAGLHIAWTEAVWCYSAPDTLEATLISLGEDGTLEEMSPVASLPSATL